MLVRACPALYAPDMTISPDAAARDAALRAVVRPVPDSPFSVEVGVKRITTTLADWATDYGRVERVPDFQRGHVWTPAQQQAYIEAFMRGTLGDQLRTLTFNCPQFGVRHQFSDMQAPRDLPDGLQCLDGLQRLTALEAWMAGTVQPFGLSLADLAGTGFDPRRGAMAYAVRISVFAFQTRAEVLDYYLAINTGGTVHAPEELARVRTLREQASGARGSGEAG